MTTATEPTDAEILDLWESFVGDPTEEFPLSNSDKLCFARAVLRSWGWPSGAADWIGASSHHLIQQPARAVPPSGLEPLTPEQVDAAAKKLAECMDYPWEHMTHDGRVAMHKHAKAVIEAAHGIKEGGQHAAD